MHSPGHRPAGGAPERAIDTLTDRQARVLIKELNEEISKWRAQLSLLLNSAVNYELDRVGESDGIEVIASVASMSPEFLSKLLAGSYQPTPKVWTHIERILLLCQASRGVERVTSAKRYFDRIVELSAAREQAWNRCVVLARRAGQLSTGIATGHRGRFLAGSDPSASAGKPVELSEGRPSAKSDADTAEELSETEPPYPPPAIPDLHGHEQRPDPVLAKTPAKFVAAMRAYHVWAGKPSYREMEHRCAKQLSYSTFRNMLNSNALPKLPSLEVFVRVLGGAPEDVQAWATAWRRIAMDDFKTIGRERRRR